MKPGYYIDFSGDILIVYPNRTFDMITILAWEWKNLILDEFSIREFGDSAYLGPL